jgi:hypothetical protein
MNKIFNFDSFVSLNEDTTKALPGTWQTDLEAKPAMVITALYKANNPDKSMREQAVEIQSIMSSLGLFPQGEPRKRGEDRIFLILRKMELPDERINNLPEETPSQQGFKSLVLVAQDAFQNAVKTINKTSGNRREVYPELGSYQD